MSYGQKNAAAEARAAQALCSHLGLPLATLDASLLGHQLRDLQVCRSAGRVLLGWRVCAQRRSCGQPHPRHHHHPALAAPQRGARRHVPVAHRNLLLLSLAAAYAADAPAASLALCLNRDDLGAYSSSSADFLRRADALLGVRWDTVLLGVRCAVRMGRDEGRGGGGQPQPASSPSASLPLAGPPLRRRSSRRWRC